MERLTLDHGREREQERQLATPLNHGRRLWISTTSCACRYTNFGIACGKLPEGRFYWKTSISCFTPRCVCVHTIFYVELQVVIHLSIV